MALEPLNEIERRVLGVLMEKAMAQPEYYPMTVNAVVAACNQKNNRDPVMDLDESSVESSLEELRKRSLVSMVLPAPGARTKRYRHEIAGRFGWEKRVMSIMTELFLRGPQTAGELRSRCSRFTLFDDAEAVATTLEYMQTSDPPLIKPLPRQPGQSAVRHTHLFYTPDEMANIEAVFASAGGESHASASGRSAVQTKPSPVDTAIIETLRTEVEDIKDQVARLAAELADLRQQLEHRQP